MFQATDSTTVMSGPVTVPKSLKLRHYLSPEFLSPAIFVPQRDTWVCWSRIRLGRDQKLCLGLKSKPHTPISSFFPQESSRIGYPMLNQVLIKLHRRSSFNWLPCNQLLIDHCFSFPLKNMGPDAQNMLNAQGCWNSCAAKYLCTSLIGWAACLYGSLGGTNVPEHLCTFPVDSLHAYSVLEMWWWPSCNNPPLRTCCCSVPKSCPTPCNPMECNTPDFPILHHLPELTQTHICWVSDAIQPSQPLSSPSPPALSLSQHQGLFQRVGSLHQVAKVLEFQLQHQHQSFQRIIRVDFLYDWLAGSPCSPRDSQESSASQCERINSSALSLLYGPILTSIYIQKNHSGFLVAKWYLCFLICCLGLSQLFFQGASVF